MKWTEAQNEAIIERNKNLLVAAAAGSGKTAVLVERIKRLVIYEKVPIERFLILTFTNAAANEMKEKIVKALNAEILKDEENRAFLKKQITALNTANISTFHAFAQEVIRRFFQVIGLEPALKVCDEAQQTLLKSKAIEELFLEEFECNSYDFISLLNAYASSKNENAVKNMIIELSLKMESLISPKEWLDNAIRNLSLEDVKFEETILAKTILNEATQDIKKIIIVLEKLIEILEFAGFKQGVKEAFNLIAVLRTALENAEQCNFYTVKKNIEDVEFFELTQKKFGKENKIQIENAKVSGAGVYLKKAKELKKGVLETLQGACNETTKKELTKTQEYAQTIKRLVLKYYQKYGEFKLEKKLMDFTDIERYAIKILEHQEVAREYQDKFEYIFIDEYQDSNPVQEKLIGLIKRKDNVFMVGDVKQSIYKFRQADPKLFEDKYKFFRDVDCAHNKKIDLNANFRSKKTVIDSVNSIFEVLMGDSYDDAARLNVGIEYDGEHKHKTEIHIIEDRGVYIEDISDEQAELLDEFDKYEKEASIIAKIVKSNVGKQIYDTKLDCVRTVELKDIVVLLRNARGIGEKFQKIFEMNDIQSYIGDSEGYFDTLEIKIIINFLKVIDNRRSDIPLISMLVSSVFDFTYDEIAKIRIEHPDGTFYEAFVKYGEKNEKAASVLKKIDEWVKLSEVLTISDFIWELMHSSGYYLFVSALPNAIQRQANLRMLLQKAQDFQDMNIRGLHEFLNYVDALKAKSVRIGQVSTVSEDDNVLRIMTIHKSKGLEFPIVIVAGLGREWKNRKDASGLVFNKDMGFAFEFSDEEKHYKRKTAWQNEIIKQNEREALEEEKRILYVAFTRAQDKLVLVGTKKIKEKNDEENDVKTDLLKLDEPKTYMDMVLNAVENSRTVETIVHEYDEIEIVAKENDEKNAKKIQILESVELEKDVHKSSELYKIIDKKLSFEYVNLKGTALKSKFSVSELNADIEEDDDEISLNEPNFGIAENAVITRAQRGTIYHTLLEHWDFKHAVDCLSAGEKNLKSYAQNLLVNLKEKNILFENEVKLCEGFLKSVYWLTKTELGKRMARAKFLKKEASFILEKEIQGQNVIVQGTIDCFFEDENGLVLVDYKTGNHENVEDSKLKERYQKQIDLYRQALCESFEERVKEAYLVFVDDKKVISM